MAKYMILVQPWAAYVKERRFFRQQQGHTQAWGKLWEPLEAADLKAARIAADKLRVERFGGEPMPEDLLGMFL